MGEGCPGRCYPRVEAFSAGLESPTGVTVRREGWGRNPLPTA